MRPGILSIGIILLVLGAVFYFVPVSSPVAPMAANNTTSGAYTARADVMPIMKTIAFLGMILGAILTVLGLILPEAESAVQVQYRREQYRAAAAKAGLEEAKAKKRRKVKS